MLAVKTHYKDDECYARTLRKLRAIMGRDRALKQVAVRKIIAKFENSDSVYDVKKSISTQQSISNQPKACI